MSPHRTVKLSKLTPGDTLVEPVFNDGLMKLLGAGCAVSERLINRLAERGVTEVVIKIPAEQSEKHQRRASLPASNTRPEGVVADASKLVEHSCHCGSVIAIEAPAADLPVAAWICKTCGAAYFGGVSTDKSRGVQLLAAQDGIAITDEGQTQAVAESTPANTAEAASSSAVVPNGKDRRQHTRYSIGVPVVAVPLRADFRIAGPAVRMTTRDISKTGIALAYTRFSDVPYYVIDFTAAGIELLQVLLKVLRVSNSGPTYEVAGQFINRLHCADWHNKCSLVPDSVIPQKIGVSATS
jgi:hypothetical protein